MSRRKAPLSWRLFQIILVGIALILIAIVLFSLVPVAHHAGVRLWLRDAYVRTALPTEYLPTAEYLMQNPLPTPEYMEISIEPGSTTDSFSDLCVYFSGDEFFNEWSHFEINKQQLPREGRYTLYTHGWDWDAYSECFLFSAENQLQPGLHLIEFQLRSTPFDTRFPMYEWAIEVEG